MLDDFVEVLAQLDLPLCRDDLLDMNVQWSHHLSATLLDSAGHRYFFKAVPAYDRAYLQEEYEILKHVSQALAGNVPVPLGLKPLGEFVFLVLSVSDSEPVRGIDDLLRNAQRPRNWLELACRLKHLNGRPGAAALPDLGELSAALPPFEAYLRSDGVGGALATLPAVLQHGDFVANNLGHRGDEPVVYDWEDFGRISVPGYDVAMLMGSLCRHAPQDIVRLLEGEGEAAAFFRALVAGSGLPWGRFVMLMPLYYALFWVVKRTHRYRSDVQATALETLGQLLPYVAGRPPQA